MRKSIPVSILFISLFLRAEGPQAKELGPVSPSPKAVDVVRRFDRIQRELDWYAGPAAVTPHPFPLTPAVVAMVQGRIDDAARRARAEQFAQATIDLALLAQDKTYQEADSTNEDYEGDVKAENEAIKL